MGEWLCYVGCLCSYAVVWVVVTCLVDLLLMCLL